jgi:hypothetical protein
VTVQAFSITDTVTDNFFYPFAVERNPSSLSSRFPRSAKGTSLTS